MADPITPTVSGELTFQVTPSLVVDWSTAVAEVTFVSWNVYRRDAGGVIWYLIASITDSATMEYVDWTAPSNTSVEYAVTQVTNVPDESSKVAVEATGNNSKYWLVVPAYTPLNTLLHNVSDDPIEPEFEMAAINLVGRGRQVQRGSNFGITGTLTAVFNDLPSATARAQRQAVERIRDTELDVYLRNPFGDVWHVQITSYSYSRVPGVGQKEHTIAAIGYTQISTEDGLPDSSGEFSTLDLVDYYTSGP